MELAPTTPKATRQLPETGVFKFTGRRADTYHVIVANPGSSDANGDNPLKFSLPESGGAFGLGDDETTATATVTLEKEQAKAPPIWRLVFSNPILFPLVQKTQR